MTREEVLNKTMERLRKQPNICGARYAADEGVMGYSCCPVGMWMHPQALAQVANNRDVNRLDLRMLLREVFQRDNDSYTPTELERLFALPGAWLCDEMKFFASMQVVYDDVCDTLHLKGLSTEAKKFQVNAEFERRMRTFV